MIIAAVLTGWSLLSLPLGVIVGRCIAASQTAARPVGGRDEQLTITRT